MERASKSAVEEDGGGEDAVPTGRIRLGRGSSKSPSRWDACFVKSMMKQFSE
jgi:hypothetical protein